MTLGDAPRVEQVLLAAVLDRLIPPGDGFPSAGEIASGYVAGVVEQGGLTPALFEEIGRRSRSHGQEGFPELPMAQQEAVLREVEAAHPEAFDALVVCAYGGYYSDATVLSRLGLDPRPPQPRGHELEPLNLQLLDQVRRRAPIYRTP